ncbi:MAG: UDP-N-acetylmuramoyl-L-alanyl-D-glutamate--2,6-diaminopimelate ligase [Bacteroidales bacterium]|nr:UDP-N-acetylmuramoyl-L-alanyl-D-glutamate--2,6-diaminopimelate ligase [Bacteroidales bacterium]
MKTLKEILHGLKTEQVINERELYVTGIVFDSRKVQEGSVFVAEKGEQTDGHLYISSAIDKGAKVVVFEDFSDKWEIKDDVTYIKVKSSSLALGIMANNFYDNPTKKLRLIGITGTNGKTTTVTLLYKMFSSMGFPCGLVSTIENRIKEQVLPTERTTPDAVTLSSLFAKMVEEGCEYAFMEVSSHAVVQNRIAGLHFFGAIFSNITLDHLDYHKTFANYIKAKKKFFDDLSSKSFALTNLDDKNGSVMIQNTKAKKYSYSLSSASSDFKAAVLEDSFEGLHLKLDNKEIFSPMIGRFNVYNLLAVYSAAVLCGIDKERVLISLSALTPARGRFECYRISTGAVAVIDYAHTPDALENVLTTINEINKFRGQKVFCIVGCGGDRDKTKRPIMGEIGQRLSDTLILTSDNPRTEDPNQILEDMKQGLKKDKSGKVHFCITDRAEAIKLACTLAKKDDIILVAGKGHEDYQEINHVKHHFDDREEILKY